MIDYKNLDILDAAGNYLIKLLFCILHEKEIPVLPNNLTWELIYNIAKMHSVEVLAFHGAQKYIINDSDLYRSWKKSRDASFIQSILQEEECQKIFNKLWQANIRFLPLKGYEIKKLYRRSEFRQMVDIDILIDPENAWKAKKVMENLGFVLQDFGNLHHDEYFKSPYITVEIHRQLLLPGEPRQFYYNNIWKKTIPNKDIPGAMQLTPEDFYIYQIAHFEKHFNRMGSGIRSLLDIYIYLEQYGATLDRTYVNSELKKLGLLDFCSTMELLSKYWFSISVPSQSFSNSQMIKLQRSIFLSGSFGSREFLKSKDMDKFGVHGGLRYSVPYFFKRTFMSKNQLAYMYPILKKHPVLLPFFWFYRLGYAILHKRKAIKRELELLNFKINRK